jgi:gamma-glutamyltranspeptidase / glutathione hydrolase
VVIGLTSTVDSAFGSRLMVLETGLILNDEMNDFSAPGQSNPFGQVSSPNNLIESRKRPQSSISPVIVEHAGSNALVLAVGAAG